MSSPTPEYEVYALRYAHAAQSAIRNFLLPNPHDGPLAMDFYVWAIRSDHHTIVVDTGFNAAVAARRRPEWQLLDGPAAALARIGIDAATTTRPGAVASRLGPFGQYRSFPQGDASISRMRSWRSAPAAT